MNRILLIFAICALFANVKANKDSFEALNLVGNDSWDPTLQEIENLVSNVVLNWLEISNEIDSLAEMLSKSLNNTSETSASKTCFSF